MRTRLIGSLCLGVCGAIHLSVMLHAASAPVADAAMRGEVQTVRALLKQGADVNQAQGDGMTALHWAAMSNNTELAQLLLYAGANVRATTRINGYTPLFLASQHGHPELVETLLKGGADAKAVAVTGSTPLMLAAAAGSVRAVELLLDAGADVNARDSARGQTALMYAAGHNRVPDPPARMTGTSTSVCSRLAGEARGAQAQEPLSRDAAGNAAAGPGRGPGA